MTTRLWERQRTIFDAALEYTGRELTEFLDSACAGEPELRRVVEQLLAAHANESGLLDTPLAQGLALDDDEAGSAWSTGDYRIGRVIGEGGMGVVCEAEQLRPVRRSVAIKLIKPGMDTREVIRRFESESQALAMMNHPSIAGVFDAGQTPQGRPYFVMELVRGEPITTFCDEQRLDIAARLKLFILVCEAVQHAHQKGVIHRDLKPHNILVVNEDARFVPKIIDFGIAKAIDQSLRQDTRITQFGRPVGTPEYMSPEQASPDATDIDTRTDIYSLGILLHELLVGVLPFEPGDSQESEQREAAKPSTRFRSLNGRRSEIAARRASGVNELIRRVRGELDWIVLRAIRWDRAERYATASELAGDLERLLRHQTVSAGPPSSAYRLRKFVRRNRAAVAVGVAIGLGTLIALGGTAAGYVKARRAQGVAQQKAETSAKVVRFLQNMLSSVDPLESPGREVTVHDILDKSAKSIESAGFEDAEVEAEIRITIGLTYQHLGDYVEAERHYDAAAELRRRALGAGHAQTLSAMHDLANTYKLQDRPAEAEALYRRVIAADRRTGNAEELAAYTTRQHLAGLLADRGELAEAEQLLREVVEAKTRLVGYEAPTTLHARHSLSQVLHRAGKLEEAEALARETLAGRERVLENQHPDTEIARVVLAKILNTRGEHAEAAALLRESIDAQTRVLGGDHPHTMDAMGQLAHVLTLSGELDEAEKLFKQILDERRNKLGEEHNNTLVTMNNLAILLGRQDKLGEATSLTRDVLRIWRRLFGRRHPNTVIATRNLASLLERQQQFEEAEGLFREAIAGAEEVFGDDHWKTALFNANYGHLLIAMDRFDEAEELLRLAYADLQRALGPDHKFTRSAADDLTSLEERSDSPSGG